MLKTKAEEMFEIELFIEHLVGTCKSLDEAKSDFDLDRELTDSEVETIDNEIFRCDGCDWWYNSEEMGRDRCQGCEEDDEDFENEDE